MLKMVEINNGEKVKAGLTVFDEKGKPIVTTEPGATVVFSASEDPSTKAQFVQDSPNALSGTVTTVGDDVGKVTFTGVYTRADGKVLNSSDGSSPQLEVTVINTPASTAEFTVGTREPEDAGQ